MPTLLLLRHAKSSWEDPTLEDFERPLSKRGARAAPLIGARLAREKLKPELVLCSPAVRTRATLALVVPELVGAAPEIVYEDALYLATAADLVERLRRLEPRWLRVMIVGHNPGLHAAALSLTGGGARKDIAALATGFPTAALAVLELPGAGWSSLAPASCRLELFVTPKELA